MNNHIETKYLEAYDKHSDAIFRYVFYRVYDYELAKDLTQEVFVKSWQYLAQGKKIKQLKSFLYKVAKNLVIDHHRKKKEESLDNLIDQNINIEGLIKNEDNIIDQTDIKLGLHLIKKLDKDYQEAVWLRYVDDLDPKEIADILDLSSNVVSVRVNRGIKKLKQLLNEHKDV